MDNITGFGGGADEITLGLNLNSNIGGSINDFNTLDQVLQQMNKDGEIFRGILSDSFDKAKAITAELKESSEAAQQLISIFRALRGEQEGTIQGAKQLASMYQQLNNELQKAQQTGARMGATGGATPVPGSSPGAQPIVTSSPAAQTGGGGGRGPIVPGQTAGFAEEPDDFFGREEVKSGGRRRRPDDLDIGGLAPGDLDDWNFGDDTGGGSASRGGRAIRPKSNEHYKQVADLALSMFPGPGYYSRLRRARWLTRNEGSTIDKFTGSPAGKKLGLALNRLGGGQRLRLDGEDGKGYQLFPFKMDDKGNYVDDSSSTVYGLKDATAENFLRQPEGGGPWSWDGEGVPPPMPTEIPYGFNPWERPNLNSTGEGAAKIAGSVYALRVAKAKGGDLFREGQLYTGITGGTGVRGALGYDLGAQLTSWFGLNPLESYGQAKQITMQNLGLGYRGNLLNQANSFGNQALQKYGVDPTTSMQMFGQMVMQAGASLSDLNASLATLAHTASTTNTSFSQLQQNVIQYSQIGSSIGLTGSQNALFATSAAQFAAGQPALGATGANPSDILDSMVGQALVAQQMGTSYLGLPQAVSQQGAGALLDSVIKVNQSLLNRIGLNSSNYKNPKALNDAYFKWQLLMKSLGRNKEANAGKKAYIQDVYNTFDGKQQKELNKTLTSSFAQDIGGRAGESAGQAINSAIGSAPSWENAFNKSNAITDEMQKIESQNKWKSIGVDVNGKFMSLSDIQKLPFGRREALEAKIATGDISISHINKHGTLVKGNYTTGTLLDEEGRSKEQFSEFGRTPNRARMHAVENSVHRIELGPKAQKLGLILENPNWMNRVNNNYAKGQASPTSDWGNPRSGNLGKF